MTMRTQAGSARLAARVFSTMTRDGKDAALRAMADALLHDAGQILMANTDDVLCARAAGTDEAIIDRLALDDSRLQSMADGLRDIAALADPVGQVVRGWTLPNGVRIAQVRVPFGVIGVIYEARPNVTADAAGICLKAGNAVLLNGSSSALSSNRAIVAALRQGLAAAGAPPDAVQLIEGGHEGTDEMMRARGLIDLLVPRGGASLIDAVVTGSQVPVIETGTGNCHLYVDAGADPDMAMRIIANAKTQRPSVCNALETLLLHRDVASQILSRLAAELPQVTLTGDQAVCALDPGIRPAEQWDAESLALELRVAIVDDLAAAIEFIGAHTSGHSETIVTNDLAHAQTFTAAVDAACVLVNASSRFVDGGQFGFGAEIGISTQKLHARGPMGLAEMTTTKYIITGDGQVRA